jgi:hypothetical protein
MANMIQAVIGSTGYEPFTIVPFNQSSSGPNDCTSDISGFQSGTYGTINGLSSGVYYRNISISQFQSVQNYDLDTENDPICLPAAINPGGSIFALSGTGIENFIDRNFFSRIEMYTNNTIIATYYLDDFVFSTSVNSVQWELTGFSPLFSFGNSFRIYY